MNKTYTHTVGYKANMSTMALREIVKFNWTSSPDLEKSTSFQDVQELMAAFDADYDSGHSKTEVSVSHKVAGIKIRSYSSNLTEREIDARYPRAEWFQMLLERGIAIENFEDYSRCLLKRHLLILLEDNLKLRQLGIIGIPPIDDWTNYQKAFIDKLVRTYAISGKFDVTGPSNGPPP